MDFFFFFFLSLFFGFIVFTIVLVVKISRSNKRQRELNAKNLTLENSNKELQGSNKFLQDLNHNLNTANHRLNASNQSLEKENKILEAERLKFQLQPHTINNILANLKALSTKLNNGMVSLSEVLEYIIYKGDQQLVTVKEEIEFIQKYLQLNEQFTDEIDSMLLDDSDIDKMDSFYKKECLPHLISAHFIENAFKHGDNHHPEFLKIKVRLRGNKFHLEVVNKISSKVNASTKEGGVGLTNMRKRLDFIFPDRYDIEQSCNESMYVSKLTLIL